MQCALPHGTRPGLVLAGGLSRRMGVSKPDLAFDGSSLAMHVARRLARQVSDIAINANGPLDATFDGPVIPDLTEDFAGPLSGVLSGLRHFADQDAAATHMITVPVDGPFFPDSLAERLMEFTDDGVIAIATSAGRAHPVFAAWPFSLADDLAAWLAEPDNRRVGAFIARHRHQEVPFPMIHTADGPVDPFFNINTPADLSRAAVILEAIR